MKTSNKIILSFLIFLFGGIFMLYVGAKNYVEPIDKTKFVTQEKALPPFSVIVAESKTTIEIHNGSKRKIVQDTFNEENPRFSPFVVRNDTLFVFSAKNNPNIKPGANFTSGIYCENVKQFVVKGGAILLNDYKVDSVFVKMNNADLVSDNNNSVFIKIFAKNSRATFNCEKLNTMQLNLHNTKLELKSKNPVKSISGTVKNSSDVKLSVDGKLNLEVDKSSYFQMLDLKN